MLATPAVTPREIICLNYESVLHHFIISHFRGTSPSCFLRLEGLGGSRDEKCLIFRPISLFVFVLLKHMMGPCQEFDWMFHENDTLQSMLQNEAKFFFVRKGLVHVQTLLAVLGG